MIIHLNESSIYENKIYNFQMNAAIDVGADDGFHGILFAFFNPNINVFAF